MADEDIDIAARLLEDAAADFERLTAAELWELGQAGIRMVTQRTLAGLDIHWRPFAPYTAAYAARRAARGLAARPDLAVTGHMVQALEASVDAAAGTVSAVFNSAHEALKAMAHNAPVNSALPGGRLDKRALEPRTWLGLEHPREIAALEEIIGHKLQLRVTR